MLKKKHAITIVMAQLNFSVGGITENTTKIIQAAQEAKKRYQADLVVYPELSVCGYPPEDLVWRHGFSEANHAAIQRILLEVKDIDLIVGHVHTSHGRLYNAISYLSKGKQIATYYKQELPNYGVFDEKRYFRAGNHSCIIELKGHRIALVICEDLWLKKVAKQAKKANADLIISANASPFDRKKITERRSVISQRAKETGLPIIYVANVGGQDDLIYDGGSFAIDSQQRIQVQAPFFKEALVPVLVAKDHQPQAGNLTTIPQEEEAVYQALVLGLRDYVKKNGFQHVLLGLSGGIDSALILCIAVDALGPEHVHAVMLPSRHTSEISLIDAKALCKNLKVSSSILSIEPTFEAFTQSLADEFAGFPSDITEENLQARCRGTLLMALANKKGGLLLSTGNKSEIAVGYCTLYGDMAGAYAPIKDVYKTEVYRLCDYRNRLGAIIPQRIIDRPPSAELAPNQTDQDTLPPYSLLDAMLLAYLERNESIDDLIRAGYDRTVINQVINLVTRSEYKRRQSAPGPRVSRRAFDREWRYPLTAGQYNEKN